MIPFNKAVYLEKSVEYIRDAMDHGKIAGAGKYTRLSAQWLEEKFSAHKVLLTTSCTAALEMCAILLDIGPGDELTTPSYTFTSTANAFALRGATIVFMDIRPDTMNLDERKLEQAITEKTKAIVVVHYAGVACEMDTIMEIAKRHSLPVIEDAAQGVMSSYKGRPLGTIGTLGCYSFHETKNYTMGEGGALLINDDRYVEHAEILWEKGTNRAKFFRGMVDKYSWVDVGSSYLPSELNAACLYAQLEIAEEINEDRLATWNFYKTGLTGTGLELPHIPEECIHNAHMFYIKVKDLQERTETIKKLTEAGVGAVFHYVPLHSSVGGRKYGRMSGDDEWTTKESERLIRLPMFYRVSEGQREKVVAELRRLFGN